MSTRARPTDHSLMARVAADDADAFEELFDRYCARAYGVARSVSREPSLAEEAVQEGFLSLWRSRSSYSPRRGNVAAWLLTIVRHRAVDAARRSGTQSHRRASDEGLENRPASSPGPSEQAELGDDAARLHVLLSRLPEAQREVITLAFFGELSHTEIATQLGLPAGTVKGRMRLGLEKLRAGIDERTARAG